MGEGGVAPEYFLQRMQWWEVQRYIDGMRRRQRPQWETTRWLGWMVSKILGSKAEGGPKDLVPFPWEEADQLTDQQLEEEARAAEELIRKCREENQRNGFQ